MAGILVSNFTAMLEAMPHESFEYNGVEPYRRRLGTLCEETDGAVIAGYEDHGFWDGTEWPSGSQHVPTGCDEVLAMCRNLPEPQFMPTRMPEREFSVHDDSVYQVFRRNGPVDPEFRYLK